jgi:hypothetical protein
VDGRIMLKLTGLVWQRTESKTEFRNMQVHAQFLYFPARSPLLAGHLLALFFEPEDGGSMFFRNIDELPAYMAPYPRRLLFMV